MMAAARFPDSGRPWSLLEMINFAFGSALSLIGKLNIIVSGSSNNMRETAGTKNTFIDNDYKKGIIDAIMATKGLFDEMHSAHIDAAIKNIESWLKHRPDKLEWSELNTLSRLLRDAINVELKQHWFFRYDKDKGHLFSKWKADWQVITKSFPDATPEIFSAVDCYALGHNTASVFHSMRIAEHGLRAIAKERRISIKGGKPIEWATWMDIIKEVDKQIVFIGNKQAGSKKDAALSFYSGARADLNGFKDEYRNSVMHVRALYDEHQAIRAINKVHGFMERVSEKIDHKHSRINWGLK